MVRRPPVGGESQGPGGGSAAPELVRRAAAVVAVFLAVAVCYILKWRSVSAFVVAIDQHDRLFEDFVVHYYPTGRAILTSLHPVPVPGYFYSAFFALLLAPVSALDPARAMWAWGAVQAVCLAALFAIPLTGLVRLTTRGLILYAAVFATSFPLLHNLKWGQVSVPLVACSLAALRAHAANRRVLAGALLGFAAAIKYYPAVFLVYFLLRRDLRACAAFAVAAIVFGVVVPVVALGAQGWLAFEAASREAVAGATWVSQNINSQHSAHVVARWVRLATGDRQAVGPGSLEILHWLARGLFLANGILLWSFRRRLAAQHGVVAAVVLFLSLPFAVPTSWPHYFSYLPFCQAALFSFALAGEGGIGTRRGAVLALAALSALGSSVFAFAACGGWYAYSEAGILFVADLLLLAGAWAVILAPPARATTTR